MFGIVYGDIMVGVVGSVQMLFLDVVKGVSEWHQGCTEAVVGGTRASVSPATDI